MLKTLRISKVSTLRGTQRNGLKARHFKLLLFLGVFLFWLPKNSEAQTSTINTNFANNNGSGTTTFNLHNTNAFPIIITEIGAVTSTAGTQTATLYYKTTPVNGAPGAIDPANGWILAATGTFTGVANTTTSVAQPVITNMSFTIPAGATYGMAVSSANFRYSTLAAGVQTLAAGGVNLIFGDNISYGGGTPPAAPTFTPRGFIGYVTFMPGVPCVAPPTPGQATASVPTTCAGADFQLGLTGASGGMGMTYQWQSSPDGTTGWTNITGATNANVTVNQTATTFYRAQLTCSGQTATSAPVQVTSPALIPAGTFTINKNNPASATNFQSITAAVNHISCGISGPIVFNVVAGSGPYNEHVVMPQIGGVSATNTITFNGNGNTVSATTTTADPGVFTLNGTDFVTLNNFTITLDAGLTTGWGIQLKNAANNNTITGNTINLPITSTSTTLNGIVAGTTSTAAGNNTSNTLIQNNTINGGYYMISINGNTGGVDAVGNQIIGNQLRDSYFHNIYLNNTDGTIVRNNNISRPTRTAVTTFYGVYLNSINKSVLVEKNRIHTTHGAATSLTGTVYGFYSTGADAPVGSENIFRNNIMFNIGNTGDQYGIYNSSSDGHFYYHNTLDLNSPNNTGTVRGFQQITAATNVKFMNNIISINSGATGAKHALYFSTTTSAIDSDRNVLWVNGGAATSGIGFFTSNRVTLADWRTASGDDINSVNEDPLFADRTTGNLMPTSGAVNNIGAPVTPPVTDDITGAVRSTTTPDPGAYEFTVPPIDLGATALAEPGSKACYTNAEPVMVTIRNWGSSPLDFSTTNATITVNVTGAATQTLNFTLNNNTANGGQPLAPGASVTIPVGTLNMSATGTYTFNASATIAGDGNAANNAMPAATITSVPLVAGTAAATQGTICLSGTTTLNLTGSTGGNVQWQSGTSATGPFTNITGATGPSYTLAAPITQTTYYQAVVSCGTTSLTTNVVPVTVNNPQVVSSTGGTACAGGPVTLTATPPPGATIAWYTTATGGTPVSTGTSYSPTITGTTTFYAAAVTGGGSTSVGPATPNALGGVSSANFDIYYMSFDMLTGATINSVDIFPDVAPGAAFTLQIQDNTGAVLFTTNGTTTVQGSTTPQTVPIGHFLAPGTGYRFKFAATMPAMFRNTSGATYPVTVPGVISVTGNNFNAAYWYYFYNIQVATGCESARVPVIATAAPGPATPTITVATGSTTTICQGGSVGLTGASTTTGATYSWSRNGTPIAGATSATYTATQAGNYRVIATAAGCSDSSAVTAITVTPTPATPTITQNGGTLTSSAATGNQWLLNGTAIPGATGQTLVTTANGAYTVVVTTNNCPSATSATTNVTNTGLGDALAGMSVQVYPNPAKGSFNVKLNGYQKDATGVLYNLTGQQIATEVIKADQSAKLFDVKGLAAGVYMLKVTSDKGVQVTRLVVE